MTLLGATGVEDILQEDVKKCIKDFKQAGIKVWMLTGDSGLTAREIGISCGIIKLKKKKKKILIDASQNSEEPAQKKDNIFTMKADLTSKDITEQVKQIIEKSHNMKKCQLILPGNAFETLMR